MSYRSVGRNIKKLVIIAGEVLIFTVSYTYVAVADGRCEHCGRSHQQNQYHQYCRGNMTHSFHTVLHAIPSLKTDSRLIWVKRRQVGTYRSFMPK